MSKIALVCLLALAGLSIASELRSGNQAVVLMAPDVPPPSCAPNCPVP